MQTIRRILSSRRDELKGLAILWVVFFHALLGLEGPLYQVQRIGYGGVDIFFFLSGYGLFYSLERDADLGRYMKRRAARLLPSYLPFCLLWLVVMLPVYGYGLATSARVAASNLSMLGFLTGSPQNISWYTGGLLVSLILAPFFHAALKPGKGYWLRAVGLLAVLTVVGIGFVDDSRYMMISRLPLMVIGMIAAGCTLSRKQTCVLIPALGIAAFAGLAVLYRCLDHYQELLVDYAMYWHPFVLIVPGFCLLFGWLFDHVPAVIGKPVAFCGAASFEIFLFNTWFEGAGKAYGLVTTPAGWLAVSFASVAFGCLYHAAVAWILKVYRKETIKKQKKG